MTVRQFKEALNNIPVEHLDYPVVYQTDLGYAGANEICHETRDELFFTEDLSNGYTQWEIDHRMAPTNETLIKVENFYEIQ